MASTNFIRELTTCSPNELRPVHGLRAISHLMVILTHVITFQHLFITDRTDWNKYVQTSWQFRLMPITAFSVETFFVLSSFLVALKISEFTFHRWILDRARRFYPGLIAMLFVCFVILKQPPNTTSIWACLSFTQNYQYVGNWMNVHWSVALDMQMYILIPVLLFGSTLVESVASKTTYLKGLLISSCMISMLRFYMTPGLLQLNMKDLSHSLNYLDESTLTWIESHYQVQLNRSWITTMELESAQLYLTRMYFPILTRFGSFIPGLIAAYYYCQRDLARPNLKWLAASITFLAVLLFSPPPQHTEISTVEIVFLCCGRQIFACCVAYILYYALVVRNSIIYKVLSYDCWVPISRLSYFSYLIHWRLGLEIIFRSNFLFQNSSFSFVCVLFPILVLTSQLCSVLFHYIESRFN